MPRSRGLEAAWGIVYRFVTDLLDEGFDRASIPTFCWGQGCIVEATEGSYSKEFSDLLDTFTSTAAAWKCSGCGRRCVRNEETCRNCSNAHPGLATVSREVWERDFRQFTEQHVEGAVAWLDSHETSGTDEVDAHPAGAIYLGDGRLHVNGRHITLEDTEDNVLAALVTLRTTNLPELKDESGEGRPERILKRLVGKYDVLAGYISLPGGRGRGGYSTTIVAG